MKILSEQRVVYAAATACRVIQNLRIEVRIKDTRQFSEWAEFAVSPWGSFAEYKGTISIKTSEVIWDNSGDIPEEVKDTAKNRKGGPLEKMKTLLAEGHLYATHVLHEDAVQGFRFEGRLPHLSEIDIYLFHTAAEQRAFEEGITVNRGVNLRDNILSCNDLEYLEMRYKKGVSHDN